MFAFEPYVLENERAARSRSHRVDVEVKHIDARYNYHLIEIRVSSSVITPKSVDPSPEYVVVMVKMG